MGNRAIIATEENYRNNGPAIYLHWNGGRDSVEAFCKYAQFQGVRGGDYGIARMAQFIGNWFGGGLSLGIVPAKCGAGDDNGVYIIDNNFNIVGREEICEGFTEQQEYDLAEMVEDINNAQPAGVSIPAEILYRMITMDKYPLEYSEKVEMLTPGTEVYIRDLRGRFERHKVIGRGEPGQWCNGNDVSGIPYVDKYDGTGDYSTNPNNYIFENTEVLFA